MAKHNYSELTNGNPVAEELPKILETCGYIYHKYQYDRENNIDYEDDKLNIIEENGKGWFNIRN
jgi:hypothetical protein